MLEKKQPPSSLTETMANLEHLKILNQGINEWNIWLTIKIFEEPKFKPDITGTNLSGADLSGIYLSQTDLSKANLSKAVFSGANLFDANLSEASLTKAYLTKADLSQANLSGANLYGACLSKTDFSGANLFRANLSEAVFSGANLSEANLSQTDLSQANLSGANLSGADLSGANLSRANLFGANLTKANLSEANLTKTDLSRVKLFSSILVGTIVFETIISQTSFSDVDLSQIIGLNSVIHHMPSTIGIDTIFRSQGKIPDIFLRRAGVPEQLITYIPSLVGKPWEYYSCFISYSSKNQDLANRLYADLQKNSVRCWLATEDLKIGDKLRNKIDEAIRMHDKLLLILSETSISSEWVDDEVESAFEKERKRKSKGNEEPVLFPIRIDDSVMQTAQAWATKIRRSRHIGDFTDWKDHDQYQKAFKRLLRDLQESRKPSSE